MKTNSKKAHKHIIKAACLLPACTGFVNFACAACFFVISKTQNIPVAPLESVHGAADHIMRWVSSSPLGAFHKVTRANFFLTTSNPTQMEEAAKKLSE